MAQQITSNTQKNTYAAAIPSQVGLVGRFANALGTGTGDYGLGQGLLAARRLGAAEAASRGLTGGAASAITNRGFADAINNSLGLRQQFATNVMNADPRFHLAKQYTKNVNTVKTGWKDAFGSMLGRFGGSFLGGGGTALGGKLFG